MDTSRGGAKRGRACTLRMVPVSDWKAIKKTMYCSVCSHVWSRKARSLPSTFRNGRCGRSASACAACFASSASAFTGEEAAAGEEAGACAVEPRRATLARRWGEALAALATDPLRPRRAWPPVHTADDTERTTIARGSGPVGELSEWCFRVLEEARVLAGVGSESRNRYSTLVFTTVCTRIVH